MGPFQATRYHSAEMISIHLFFMISGQRSNLVHEILGIRPPAEKRGEARTPRISWTKDGLARKALRKG